MERKISGIIPLKDENVDVLAIETKNMIRANALGIPLISIIQGLFAVFGYWIFGVKDYLLWGFITAIFAFFPVVGTAFIWILSMALKVSHLRSCKLSHFEEDVISSVTKRKTKLDFVAYSFELSSTAPSIQYDWHTVRFDPLLRRRYANLHIMPTRCGGEFKKKTVKLSAHQNLKDQNLN